MPIYGTQQLREGKTTVANITYLVVHTPRISTEIVATYKDITRFRVGMHHMYVKAKKDPTRQWFPTSYMLTTENVNLTVNDWKEDWKRPTEKTGKSKEEEEQDKSDEEQGDKQGKDQTNGAGDMPGPSTSPKIGIKWKDTRKEQVGGRARKLRLIERPHFIY